MQTYQILDKHTENFLKRGFVSQDGKVDSFHTVQDPTFLSFQVKFVNPIFLSDVANSTSDDFLINVFSHEGLFKNPYYDVTNSVSNSKNTGSYNFHDSAQDYLYSIGAVNRLNHLIYFKQLLIKLQEEAPWYFQKISGTEELFKINPQVNTRKDIVLTFECLESVDMRMSLLADMYRIAVWDFERHREVLPYNLRTFRMIINVLEMRNFNTTTGRIANAIKNLSYNAIDDKSQSVFDAISVQQYDLGLCEFDFFSEVPSYMSDLSVSEIPQSNFRFKVKCGTVRKTAKYSFYDFITDEIAYKNVFPNGASPFNSFDTPKAVVPTTFYEPNSKTMSIENKSSSLFPSSNENDGTLKRNQNERNKNSSENILSENNITIPETLDNTERVRRTGFGGSVLNALEGTIATQIDRAKSFAQSVYLGNAYSNFTISNGVNALSGFFNPDLVQQFENVKTIVNENQLGELTFDKPTTDSIIQPKNIFEQ